MTETLSMVLAGAAGAGLLALAQLLRRRQPPPGVDRPASRRPDPLDVPTFLRDAPPHHFNCRTTFARRDARPQTCWVDADSRRVVDDGDILAFVSGGKIEVWSSDGETHLGFIPAGLSMTEAELVAVAVKFWEAGTLAGHQSGMAEAQADLRAAIGCREAQK